MEEFIKAKGMHRKFIGEFENSSLKDLFIRLMFLDEAPTLHKLYDVKLIYSLVDYLSDKRIDRMFLFSSSQMYELPSDFAACEILHFSQSSSSNYDSTRINIIGYSSDYEILAYAKITKMDNPIMVINKLEVLGNEKDVKRYKLEVVDKLNKYDNADNLEFRVFFIGKMGLTNTAMYVKVPEKFHPSLYPYIRKEEIFEGYFRSESPILLLNGPPGTGKSVLTKLILKEMKRTYSGDEIFFNVAFAKDPQIINDDKFWYEMISTDMNAIVFDDFDKFLLSRDKGNELMNKLLSFSDGVVSISNKMKIIITTNYDDIKYDSAFIRPGRLYNYVSMRSLSKNEIYNAIKYLNVKSSDFEESCLLLGYDILKGLTLAELFEAANYIRTPLFKNKIVKSNDIVNEERSVGFSE